MATQRFAHVVLSFGVSLAAAGLCGCGVTDATDTTPPIAEPVCTTCDPITGGETSDFGSEITACEAANERFVIHAEEAAARGFDIARATERIGRTIDAPLHWAFDDAADDMAGRDEEPPSGYEVDTRVQAQVRITRYTHVLPGDEHCDETTCEIEGNEPFARDSCPDRLEIDVEVTLKTLDGAVDAVAEGVAAIWGQGYDDVIGEGTADEMYAHAQADLRDVAGNLQLFPDTSMPHVGVLALQLDFLEDETRGYLWPTIIYPISADAGREYGWIPGAQYRPLEGTFPGARETSGPDVGTRP